MLVRYQEGAMFLCLPGQEGRGEAQIPPAGTFTYMQNPQGVWKCLHVVQDMSYDGAVRYPMGLDDIFHLNYL